MRSQLRTLAFLVAAATPIWAQSTSPLDCRSAAAYVSGRALPSTSDTTLAWNALSACDTTGEAAAVLALQSAVVVSETDSTKVQQFMAMFSQRRTMAFFNAFQSVILNPQASDYFKRVAIRAYGDFYAPRTDFSQAPMSATTLSACQMTYVDNSPQGSLSNMSPLVSQMVSTMASAAANPGNSAAARGQATCWMLLLQRSVPAVMSKLQITYVCGNTFKIVNTNGADLNVHADVIPPTALQKIEHQVNTVAGGGGIWMLLTQQKGNVRLSFNNLVGPVVVNGSTVCH